jgi:hypothetical protein
MKIMKRSGRGKGRVRPNALRFSCGPKPAATQMNLFLWLHARQLQTLVRWRGMYYIA